MLSFATRSSWWGKWHSKPRSCNCRVDAKYRWYYLDLASPKLCLPFLGLTYAVMLRGYARQAQEGAYYLSVYCFAACFVYTFGMLLSFLWWSRLLKCHVSHKWYSLCSKRKTHWVFYSFAIHLGSVRLIESWLKLASCVRDKYCLARWMNSVAWGEPAGSLVSSKPANTALDIDTVKIMYLENC